MNIEDIMIQAAESKERCGVMLHEIAQIFDAHGADEVEVFHMMAYLLGSAIDAFVERGTSKDALMKIADFSVAMSVAHHERARTGTDGMTPN